MRGSGRPGGQGCVRPSARSWFHYQRILMSINRRLLAVPVLIGTLAVAAALLLQSHAQASGHHLTFSHLNKIQKRLISQTLASAIGPSTGVTPNLPQDGGEGLADGAPNTKPSSFPSVGGASGSGVNYVPGASGKCNNRLGNNVKVNQNCLNVSDPDLQGRGQANNETFDALRMPHNPSTSSPATTTTFAATEHAARTSRSTAGKTGRTPRFPMVSPVGSGTTRVSTGRPAATRRWHGTRVEMRT